MIEDLLNQIKNKGYKFLDISNEFGHDWVVKIDLSDAYENNFYGRTLEEALETLLLFKNHKNKI